MALDRILRNSFGIPQLAARKRIETDSRLSLVQTGGTTHIILACIIVIAVALRLASALLQGDEVVALSGTFDQISYDTLARQVLAGRGFSFPAGWWPATRAGEPTAHWSFLYTLYLVATYALFGLHPIAARVIQAIVAGIVQPWLTWRISTRVFGRRTGLIASALSATYVYFVYYAGALMTETYCILAILWAIDLATWLVQFHDTESQHLSSGVLYITKTMKPWLLLGIAFGIAALLRQVVLLFVPLALLWLLWTIGWKHIDNQAAAGTNRWRKPIIGMFVSVVVMLVAIAPWTVRNYYAFGRFVPLNTNAGYAFFWANHPIYGTDFVPILTSVSYYELIPPELLGLDEAALDQALLQRGLRFVVEDPHRYVLLSVSRLKSYFEFWPTSESGLISSLSRVLSFGILLPFMLYGLFLSATRLRSLLGAQRSMLVLLYLFVVVYSLIHLLSWALIRYRLPVDAVLLPFAGLAIADSAGRMSIAPLRHLLRQEDTHVLL